MKIGTIEVLPVLDGTGRERADEVLTRPGVPDAWACHSDQLDDHGTLHLDLGGFLVRTGARTILVDAGVGTIDNGKYAGGRFLDSLRGYGVGPEDVTDVVFTHLHFDHVGWATKKGRSSSRARPTGFTPRTGRTSSTPRTPSRAPSANSHP